MSFETAEVLTINLEQKFVLMSDDEILPITNSYDSDGEDCDLDEAVVIVAGRDGYGWLTIDILDKTTVN